MANLAVAAGIDSLQRQGVKAYAAGNYEQALKLFNQAVAKNPEEATALYNQGTALYKLGRFSEASQAFTASGGADNNDKARAKAAYNQGRSQLSEGKGRQDLAKKKALLLAANQAFQQSLRDDPRLQAARKGIVDCRKEFAKVTEQEKKAKQDPQQQGEKGQKQGQQDQSDQAQGQEQQDRQKQLNEAGQKQQDMANKSKEASSATSQEGASPEELKEMAAEQQSVRQTLEKIKKELSKNQEGQGGGDQNNSKDLNKKLKQAIKTQKKAEEALGKGDLSQAQEHQQQAADILQELAAEQDAAQKDKAEQAASSAVGKDKPKAGAENAVSPPSPQQVEEQDLESQKTANTVADILDGEKALHEMRRLRLNQQRPASGKDW